MFIPILLLVIPLVFFQHIRKFLSSFGFQCLQFFQHFKFHFKLNIELTYILLPTLMMTRPRVPLRVSGLIEFLFRKLKAFHYFAVVKVQHAFGRFRQKLIMRLYTTRATMCL